MLKKYKGCIYIILVMLLAFLDIVKIPPFFVGDDRIMFIFMMIISGAIIDPWDHSYFKNEEGERTGTWLAYLKGLSLYLIILIIFFILWFRLPLYKILIYSIISVFSTIIFSPRPLNNSWKVANKWANLSLVITLILYVIDYGIIAYFFPY